MRPRRDCRRADLWMAAIDAGELDQPSCIRLLDHLESCAPCAARARGITSLVALVRKEPAELPPDRLQVLAARVLAASSNVQRTHRTPLRRWSPKLAAVAALLVLSVGGLLLWGSVAGRSHYAPTGGPRPGTLLTQCATSEREPAWRVVSLEQARLLLPADGRPARSVKPGDHLVVDHGGRAFLASAAEFIVVGSNTRLTFTVENCGPALQLRRGRLVVRTRGGGPESMVLAGPVRVRPIGTVYAVEWNGTDLAPEVAVLAGRVQVFSTRGSAAVEAGQHLLSNHRAEPLASGLRRRLESELQDAELTVDGSRRSAVTASKPASRALQEEPLDMREEVRAVERLLARGATRKARARAQQALAREGSQRWAPALATLVAESHLRERSYAPARKAYLEVWNNYAHTPYGGDALYMVGSLELDQLKRPELARRHFERYLGFYQRGRQRQGAFYLLCRSLLRLGEEAAARAAASRYLAEFPHGQFRKEVVRIVEPAPGTSR